MELLDSKEYEEEGTVWVTEQYGINGVVYATNTYRSEQ